MSRLALRLMIIINIKEHQLLIEENRLIVTDDNIDNAATSASATQPAESNDFSTELAEELTALTAEKADGGSKHLFTTLRTGVKGWIFIRIDDKVGFEPVKLVGRVIQRCLKNRQTR
jgi:hypothetical protein